ncbi:MAG TPA: signal recognition particle protein, partial [Alphaproteobacteria bacterium]|nr:signal recognition particle protein [Alphaproteobacteria bacterium]
EAIILSMTKKERRSVGLLNASRRKRIAAGSGTSVQEVNRLVKQYQDMAKM